ncbi:hypothetical protein Tco_0407233 [Tanacetum coccineum]
MMKEGSKVWPLRHSWPSSYLVEILKVATLGLEVAKWKIHGLRDMNIAAYTERFNELALLCPDVVPNEKKKVELYIKGLPEIIKGETTSSRPAMLNDV